MGTASIWPKQGVYDTSCIFWLIVGRSNLGETANKRPYAAIRASAPERPLFGAQANISNSYAIAKKARPRVSNFALVKPLWKTAAATAIY